MELSLSLHHAVPYVTSEKTPIRATHSRWTLLLKDVCFPPPPQISAQVSSEVSSQVRRELRALFYGTGQAGEGHDGALPESLVLWLSQRYVGGPELQASLAALELAILSNVSEQLERSREQTLLDAQAQAQTISETVSQTISHSVQHSDTAQGLSEEVRALRLALRWGKSESTVAEASSSVVLEQQRALGLSLHMKAF